MDQRTAQALADAERSGFRLMLISRNLVLAAVGLWLAYWSRAWISVAVPPLLLAFGLLAHWLLATGRHRVWHRYALLVADIGVIALVALEAPLAAGVYDVPRIFLFRASGIHTLFFIVVATSLTLSPRYVLTAGSLLFVVYWYVYYDAVSAMPATRTWTDLPPAPTAEQYMGLVLDPTFIAAGSRIQESATLLVATLVLAAVVARTRRFFVERLAAEAETRRAEALFGRFVPANIVRDLMASPEALRPTIVRATVLHLDVEGFTGMAEGADPVNVFSALQRLLDDVVQAVTRHGGTVVATAGDAALVTFGAPVSLADHPRAALAAARDILAGATGETIEGQSLKLRIGIATGDIAAGILGEGDKQSYTVYGDTVNVAQRLQASNKAAGTGLTLACETFDAAGGADGFGDVEEIALPGRTAPVRVRRLLANDPVRRLQPPQTVASSALDPGPSFGG